MATAKPSRTRKQPSAKPPTPAQLRMQKDKIAEQKTHQMADAAYRRAYRHAQVAIARQQAKADAMKDTGIKPQQQQPPAQSKQKPPAKPARKPSNRKPPKW